MKYITERRGGYDDWSEEHHAILGLVLNDGTKIPEGVIEGTFTDQNGTPIEVELPMRREVDKNITVEHYEPEYDYWKLTLSTFEKCLDGQTFDTDKADRLSE